MDRIETIRSRLQQALDPVRLEIGDDSHRHAGHAGARESGGGHFTVTIVSGRFRDQSTLQRHRMVYAAVEDLIPQEIHALGISALSPDEQP